MINEYVGTKGYLSPEKLLGKPYSFNSDIWSLGIVFYEILYKITPFDINSSKVIRCEYSFLNNYHLDFQNLIKKILVIENRISLEDILKEI